MQSAFGRLGVVGLITFWLACSTEDTGLRNGIDADTNSVQTIETMDAQPVKPASKPDRSPDLMVVPPDAATDTPVMVEAGPEAGPPDLAPDLPPKTDQPQGAACGAGKECRSGHCVDGFCCDKACDDGCNACSLARTGRANGTCSWARDTNDKPCGKACSSVATMPAVVEKVCVAGACVVPTAPKVLTNCRDANPCVVAFCDNNEARCVKTTCPTMGTCCCKSSSGARMCSRRDQCTGSKMCE
jgi:hypothetical protein